MWSTLPPPFTATGREAMFNRTAVENHLLLRWNWTERVEMLRASWQLTTDLS